MLHAIKVSRILYVNGEKYEIITGKIQLLEDNKIPENKKFPITWDNINELYRFDYCPAWRESGKKGKKILLGYFFTKKYKEWKHDISKLNLEVEYKHEFVAVSVMDILQYEDDQKAIQYIKEHYSQNDIIQTMSENFLNKKEVK